MCVCVCVCVLCVCMCVCACMHACVCVGVCGGVCACVCVYVIYYIILYYTIVFFMCRLIECKCGACARLSIPAYSISIVVKRISAVNAIIQLSVIVI